MNLRSARLWLVFFFGLAACAQAPIAELPSTPAVVQVYLTSAAHPIEAALRLCEDIHPHIALDIQPAPPSEPASSGALLFAMHEPEEALPFAAPVADEQVVVILHPANPLTTLSSTNLAGLFTGEITSWETLGWEAYPVHSWVYPAENEIRRIFEDALLSGGANRVEHSEAYMAPSPQSMLSAVAADPGAVGYLPSAWLDERVKGVKLDSALTSALRRQVLALSPSQPEGAARAILGCLQSPTGQEKIREVYVPWTFTPSP